MRGKRLWEVPTWLKNSLVTRVTFLNKVEKEKKRGRVTNSSWAPSTFFQAQLFREKILGGRKGALGEVAGQRKSLIRATLLVFDAEGALKGTMSKKDTIRRRRGRTEKEEGSSNP